VSAARAEILARIRAALGDTAASPEVARDYRQAGTELADVDRFCERVADYRATVHRVARGDLGDALATACRVRGARRVAVPSEPPGQIEGVELVRDDPRLSARDLDGLDDVLRGCALGSPKPARSCSTAAGARAGGR
jgi:L-lactate dehydrogenase complex protein LldG